MLSAKVRTRKMSTFNTFSFRAQLPPQLKLFRQPEEISIFYRLSDKFLTFYFIFSSSSIVQEKLKLGSFLIYFLKPQESSKPKS